MFKLFHSKLFRQNLAKWMFMYIAVIGLLTSVVTYSKYISNLANTSDEARAAKFIIDIKPYNTDSFECEGQNCTTNVKVRPTKEIEIYFKVDLNQLEVKSNVVLRASAGTLDGNYVEDGAKTSQLEILRIDEVDEDRKLILNSDEDYELNKIDKRIITTGKDNLSGQKSATASFVFTPKKKNTSTSTGTSGESALETEQAQKENIKYIRVIAKYKFNENDKDEYNKDDEEIDFRYSTKKDEIRIGYSATQEN